MRWIVRDGICSCREIDAYPYIAYVLDADSIANEHAGEHNRVSELMKLAIELANPSDAPLFESKLKVLKAKSVRYTIGTELCAN